MHKTGPFTNSGVSKFVKLVVVYTKHQQLHVNSPVDIDVKEICIALSSVPEAVPASGRSRPTADGHVHV